MNRVGHGELAKGLSLNLHQRISSMVHSSRNEAILPSGVIHIRQCLQLLENHLLRPSILWQIQIPYNAWPRRHQLTLQLRNSFIDLLLNLRSHTWRSQEQAIEISSDDDISICERPKNTPPLKLQQTLSRPS